MKDDIGSVVEKLSMQEGKLLAIQAMWDGDTIGWLIRLEGVFIIGDEYRIITLAFIRDQKGDFRLFSGQVPPWPESYRAIQLGQKLADLEKVPFHFPSPNWPELYCASWELLEKSIPCSVCGIPLIQDQNIPWRGMCYHCHLESIHH